MRPDKSESFTFHRNGPHSASDTRIQNCRRKLQDKFETSGNSNRRSSFNDENSASLSVTDGNRSTRVDENGGRLERLGTERRVLSVLNLTETKRAFRSGAEKISKTFSNVRTTFGSLSQKFKSATRRRQILEEGPVTPGNATPHTASRNILGRTPTRLYSPFSIDSPYSATTTPNNQPQLVDKENETPQMPPQSQKPIEICKNNLNFFQRKRNLLDDIFN